MPRSWMKPFSATLLVAFCWSFLLYPPLAMAQAAQAPDAAAVCSTAEADAKTTHSGSGYLMAGFFCGIFGWAIAASSSPSVPADKLAAQPPEFVDTYARCYTAKAKKINKSSACTGWMVGAAVSLTILTVSQTMSDVNSLK